MGRIGVPAAYIRGGTSKAVFFHDKDIPAQGPRRDAFLQRVMGSPQATQIDGMGGTRITTSKIAIIKPSEDPEIDVDYLFVQVGITDNFVAYDGNCGNISAAVGPFAIDEGLVKKFRPGVSVDSNVQTQEVRIFNVGTKKTLISHVPIDKETGMPQEVGDYGIAGVPGTGAPILMDYRGTIGAAVGKGLLPTGNITDTFRVDNRDVDCTICDVANVTVFVKAEDVGLTGSETSAEVSDNASAISKLRVLRGKAAQKIGLCKNWNKVDEETPMIPFVTVVAPSVDDESDIRGRFIGGNKCHDAMAGTVSMCMAACSRIAGSVVDNALKERCDSPWFRISHPSGVMPVTVEAAEGFHISVEDPKYRNLSFVRTARRLMDGKVYVPDEPAKNQ